MKRIRVKKAEVFCVLGGIALYLLVEFMGTEDTLEEGHILKRASHGQGEVNYELLVEGLDETEIPVDIAVGERQYTKEEAEKICDHVMEELGERILGDNQSLGEVRSDLQLVSRDDKYGIRIRWESEDPELVDSFGTVYNDKAPPEGMPVCLKAFLTDGTHEAEYDLEVRVFPRILTKREETAAGFSNFLTGLDKGQQTEDRLVLPKQYEGTNLHYRTKDSADHKILLVLGVLLAVLCYAKDQLDAQKRERGRDQQMLMDYSEIVAKFMVFIGAGMTVRLAWERITENYEKALKSGRKSSRYAYEEMYRTVCQLRSGTPESQAYSAFGRRCGLQPYLKLAGLLEQNRRTGTKNLRDMLQTEMAAAFEQRKNLAKRLGEEAGTKLLMPLFMMLGIVMVMIVVPAFLSFY